MMKGTIAKERFGMYVYLAEQFILIPAKVQAARCVLSALDLCPTSEEAAELLRRAAGLPDVEGPPTRPGDAFSRLSGFKDRLDVVMASEKQVSGSLAEFQGPQASHAPASDAASSRPVKAFDVHPALEELEERYRRLPERETVDARTGSAEAPGSDAASDPFPPDHWGEFSLMQEWHNLGNDYYKLGGHFDRAADCYTHAIALDPEAPEPYFNRCLSYCRLGRYEDALQDINKVIEINDGLVEAYYTKGLVYRYMQDDDRAEEEFRRALKVDPDYVKAREELDVIRRKKEEARRGADPSANARQLSDEQTRDFSRCIEHPTCSFDDVGGNYEAKRQLQLVCAWGEGHEALENWGVAKDAPRGVLLYGPPGCGKTLLARCVAARTGLTFLCVPCSSLLSLWYGVSPANVRNLFAFAAEQSNGAIIFLDECESLLQVRTKLSPTSGEDCHQRTVSAVLEAMDGFKDRRWPPLIVLGSTNNISNIDEAFLYRPGRFTYLIQVKPPISPREALEIWLIHLARQQQACRIVDCLVPPLRCGVLATDRDAFLTQVLRGGDKDETGLLRLARASIGQPGDVIREVCRRTFYDRAIAEINHVHLGGISADDLMDQLANYLNERRRITE
jgi:tetratricopeptide (TPR) repeat protein